MSTELPFRLKVAGTDEVHAVRAVSTSFRFHGWLRLEGTALHLDWSGYAQVQDVEVGSIRDERIPLPAETLLVPCSRLRRSELLGGWWRPRLALTARDLRALALVPSEEHGMVHFWYARRDRSLALALAADLSRAIVAAAGTDGSLEQIVHFSDTAPVIPPSV